MNYTCDDAAGYKPILVNITISHLKMHEMHECKKLIIS